MIANPAWPVRQKSTNYRGVSVKSYTGVPTRMNQAHKLTERKCSSFHVATPRFKAEILQNKTTIPTKPSVRVSNDASSESPGF